MFIAHAPLGYLFGSSFVQRFARSPVSARLAIWTCIAGSLAPDLDMLYFYLIDQRQTHHHKYFSHWPILWSALLVASIGWSVARRHTRAAAAAVLFTGCAMVHIVMDTLVGDIWWLAPMVDRPFSFFTVDALYQPWWLNFVLHWTFALELALLTWAILRYRRRSRGPRVS